MSTQYMSPSWTEAPVFCKLRQSIHSPAAHRDPWREEKERPGKRKNAKQKGTSPLRLSSNNNDREREREQETFQDW
jgi:hypothetical protein